MPYVSGIRRAPTVATADHAHDHLLDAGQRPAASPRQPEGTRAVTILVPARLKDGVVAAAPTVTWFWERDVRIAVAPAVRTTHCSLGDRHSHGDYDSGL